VSGRVRISPYWVVVIVAPDSKVMTPLPLDPPKPLEEAVEAKKAKIRTKLLRRRIAAI